MTATISAPLATVAPRAPGLLTESEWEEKYGIKFSEHPQCFTRLPREAYDDLPGINASLTKEVVDKTAAHAKALFDPDREKVDNANFLHGNLAHCQALEWDCYDERYVVLPEDAPKRPTERQLTPPKPGRNGVVNTATKAYEAWEEAQLREAWWLEFEQRFPNAATAERITAKDHEIGQRLANAILKHPALGPRFDRTDINRAGNEITLTWVDSLSGARLKARLDAVRFMGDHIWIGDVKTAQDAGPGQDHFGRAAANFGYIIQAAFYRDAVYFCKSAIARALGLDEINLLGLPIVYEWIAVEKAAPRPEFIGRYLLTEEQETLGRQLARKAIDAIVQAQVTGYWPGYDTAATPLQIPGYAYQKMLRQLEEA
jgi:hypothetical protein